MQSGAAAKPCHIPVLTKEVIKGLQAEAGGSYVDCTVGLGGHAVAIMESITPGGRLLGIDLDADALSICRNRLKKYGNSVTLVNDNYGNIEAICNKYHYKPVDGILFDLGVCSLQLDSVKRGFSFQSDAPLDMRFNSEEDIPTAADIINSYSERDLATIIKEYGEESHSRQIASLIVQNRPIYTTAELSKLIYTALRYRHGKINPATKTFMAFRIAVNRELDNLRTALEQVTRLLHVGGRLVVISYHSLEDRIVKQFIKRESTDCLCPPDVPVCHCGHAASLKIISKKVIKPSLSEIKKNPRSRSGKMRVAEQLR